MCLSSRGLSADRDDVIAGRLAQSAKNGEARRLNWTKLAAREGCGLCCPDANMGIT